MAFDEKGQADTFERKIEICERRLQHPGRRGRLPAEDIIFDPNIFAIATGIEEHDNYAVDFIEATRWIKAATCRMPRCRAACRTCRSQLPRQRPGARGHPHRVPVPRDPGRHGRWASSTPAMLGVYDDLDAELRERVEDIVLNRQPVLKDGADSSLTPTERLLAVAEQREGRGQGRQHT